MAVFPLGPLVSFCDFTFEPFRSTYVTDYNFEFATSPVALPDAEFPADLWFSGPAPLKTPQASWQYLILADCPTDVIPLSIIEEKYGELNTAFMSPTGQKGDLIVSNAAQTQTLSCKARISKFPLKLIPGKNNTSYVSTITFELYSPWAVTT